MGLFDRFTRKKKPAGAAQAEPEPQVPDALAAACSAASAPKPGGPSRLRTALNRTRAYLATAFATDPTGLVDEEFFEALADSLVLADTGVELAQKLVAQIRRALGDRGLVRKSDVPNVARDVIAALLDNVGPPEPLEPGRLALLLLVGVNGSGKTTLAAKLAHRLKSEGRSVLLAAADTFRAAAVEQLEIWAARAGVEIVSGQTGADPAAVVFDAAQAARARGTEVLIIDTAGRLQTKHNLMQELEKITRTIDKALGDGGTGVGGTGVGGTGIGGTGVGGTGVGGTGVPPVTLPNHRPEAGATRVVGAQIAHILVLDATVGQNALSQAELFNECCPLTGLAITKLDGTAKGGALLAVVDRLRLPVLYVGVGETLDDLLDFDAADFAAGLVE